MLELTARARDILAQNKVDIQLIIEIDGIDMVFGVTPVRSLWKIGDANIRFGDPDLYVGGIVTNPKSKNVIDPDASTKTISQQLEIERGVSSVSNVKVRIVDENDFATELFSPGPTNDILGRGCTLYIALAGTSHPEDSIRVFDGMIDDCVFGAGYADLNISHPEQFKRQAIFPKWESEILTALPSSTAAPAALTINVTDASELLSLPNVEGAYTYLKLDKEVVSFTNINQSLNQISYLLLRNMFQTATGNHQIDDKIESFYFFRRNPIELALMLLCSRKTIDSQYYAEGVEISEIVTIPAGGFKARFRCNANDIKKFNVQVGDSITISASGAGTHDAANFQTIEVKSIAYDGINVDIYTDVTGFVDDKINTYAFSAVSKWNVLPDGCGIANRYIDFEGFDNIRSVHGAELADCEIFLKDTIEDAKEFIDLEILKPQGLYSLPRKGRISIGKTVPPVANKETKVLNERNITNASKLRIGRSINRNFYNAVIYKYEEHPNEDKFLVGTITVDPDSLNRIKVGNKPLLIEAKSLRKNADTTKVIQSQTKRLLERYKYAAESIEVEVDFETGINIDVGDTAVCQFKNLKVSDTTAGTRNFAPRLMEVTNKKLNIPLGRVSLSLTNTVFEVDGRYATISPSSFLGSGSSTSLLKLKKSFSRKNDNDEKGKWDQYLGQKIIVRSPDWSVVYESEIEGFDTNTDSLIVTPLPVAPAEDYIVESPKYDDSSVLQMDFWKRLHCYANPTVEVVASAALDEIEVDPADFSKFLVGAVVVVHHPEYTNKSNEVTVKELDAVNSILVLSQNLTYAPSAGDLIDLIGFKDGGMPYRIV